MVFIQHFGSGAGAKNDKYLFGNKGSNLIEVSNLGVNVPPGFVISTDLCRYYYNNNKKLPPNFDFQLQDAIKKLEENIRKKFGDLENPLLLSVRSGACVSMPGMMDTILNVGLNDQTCTAIGKKTNHKFALDSYLRLIKIYCQVVMFGGTLGQESLLAPVFQYQNYDLDKITESELKKLLQNLKQEIKNHTKKDFCTNLQDQLYNSIIAVLESWNSNRATIYRKLNNIPEDIGTAIIVQSMVFGNLNSNSGTGVVFSRNPSTGENNLFGEFLSHAQGEDIVSGSKTPFSINDAKDKNSLLNKMPDVFNQLSDTTTLLEKHFKDAQDIEFTIEDGKLYILQARKAKRTTTAAIKIAVDMQSEGLISKEEAIGMIEPDSLSHLMHIFVDYKSDVNIVQRGLPASPGAAFGKIVFSSEEAFIHSSHTQVILVRNETTPEDIKGMHAAVGILTAKGGMTSHAAVVARGMGKPCVCGANISINNKTLKIGEHVLTTDDYITIDGSTGNIIIGKPKFTRQGFSKEFDILMQWAEKIAKLKVRANAESIFDIETALKFKTDGIGLCRTEHMLFEKSRLKLIRQIILAESFDEKQSFINELFILHKQDFKEIFNLLNDLPINIRLLDPPLHEFLPKNSINNIASELKINPDILSSKLLVLEESNPMLGHRGSRLAMTLPELYEMQVRAILEALYEVKKEKNSSPKLEIMLPLIMEVKELKFLTDLIKTTTAKLNKEKMPDADIKYKIGTMIELPRACFISDELAEYADYFSFGTNDLTQTTFGLSRDDMASFWYSYMDQGIIKKDPFVHFDEKAVGELVKIACQKGRKQKPDITIGVCGEHAAHSEAIKFFNDLNFDYISCSPFRIIIAKLAAAKAQLEKGQLEKSQPT